MNFRTAFWRAGFSLLEVLIALLVLSIGLIGVGVLTVQSLQGVHSSLNTTMASAAALDLEERLWLEVGSSAEGSGCPKLVQIEGAFLDQWRVAPLNLGLPSLELIPEDKSESGRWVRMGFQLEWAERRFEGEKEAFRYFSSVPCRGEN